VGKATEVGRPRQLFIQFRGSTAKNEVMSKLSNAEETHDVTVSERELCRTMVKECKEKQ